MWKITEKIADTHDPHFYFAAITSVGDPTETYYVVIGRRITDDNVSEYFEEYRKKWKPAVMEYHKKRPSFM